MRLRSVFRVKTISMHFRRSWHPLGHSSTETSAQASLQSLVAGSHLAKPFPDLTSPTSLFGTDKLSLAGAAAQREHGHFIMDCINFVCYILITYSMFSKVLVLMVTKCGTDVLCARILGSCVQKDPQIQPWCSVISRGSRSSNSKNYTSQCCWNI